MDSSTLADFFLDVEIDFFLASSCCWLVSILSLVDRLFFAAACLRLKAELVDVGDTADAVLNVALGIVAC